MDLTKEQIIEVLRHADAVCLDVDSTLCPDEGIDELAKFHGVGDEVIELTNKAMGGSMTFQEALRERIKIINPTYIRLKTFLQQRTPIATPGAKELIDKLRERGCYIYLISGGFTEIINPTAKMIGIPREDILANKFLYYYTGQCVSADESLPTCRSGGKAKAIEELRKKHGYKKIVMIGDGATDLEACPPADAFIGFGANVVREVVKEKANWFVYSFQEILDELKD
uniref:phosphoserine phosphatase-like n=1 Tax=Styela clava TaxID=7725 RepID=UPI00193A1D4B|nr:phosphoserine phosphatase-like [Styela clava]